MSEPEGGRQSRALRRLQRKIERYYGLERAPDVVDFVATDEPTEREVLLVRETDDSIELKLLLPDVQPLMGANDGFLQLLEGVSHFVYLAERVRVGLPSTQLELELQAEVDKFVLLAFGPRPRDPVWRRDLHTQLYERVLFLHPEGSEVGQRYRLANELAARFTSKLMHLPALVARAVLQRFYRAGQSEKIWLARAA